MDKTYYMIGNAHLDPVWQWQWTEGYAETKATFRSALDRMTEFEDFIFVCSSASIYEWVEECVPSMFEEIKKRINEGRWIVVGGWWVQPDCNLPSGESFARHSLYSQNYFYNKFGVTAKVGYNVDSFGHNQMLPQILKKSGMNYYVFMRPGEHEKKLPTNIFNWKSPDGSSVLTYRLTSAYCNNFENYERMMKTIADGDNGHDNKYEETMVFYGVGNHGGGPTIKNISLIKEFQENYKKEKVIFGNPEDFFKKIIEKGYDIKELNDDLQHHASGCYSACSMIKTLNRKCENKLLAAEKYSVMADIISGKNYPLEKFRVAWKNTLFNQFHDSLGGCSIKNVYDDAEIFAGEALSIAAKSENGALQTISWQIDTMGREETPIIIFNPHSCDIRTEVVINRMCKGIIDNNGDPVPVQYVKSPTESCTHRKDTLFTADIPAYGYTVYYCCNNEYKFENTVSVTDNVIENKYIKVVFEKHTGYIKEMYDKINNYQILDGYGAVPVVIEEFEHDTWSHARNFFTNQLAKFSDAEIKIIDDGPLKATVKVTSKYNNSVLSQYFSLGCEDNKLTVSANIDWHEKHKMLKLGYTINTTDPKAIYEIPFGFIERPCDGEEESGQQWFMIKGTDKSAVILNDNKYSFSVQDKTMYLTVVRSPIYGDHGGPRNDESIFTDQGSHEFNYIVMPVKGEVDYNLIIKSAQLLNNKPVHIIENRHEGTLKTDSYKGININKPNIIMSAFKKAENAEGYIIRLYETDGVTTDVLIKLSILNTEIKTSFGKYEVKTFYINADDKSVKEVMLTEFDI